jgi:hypothetical protein
MRISTTQVPSVRKVGNPEKKNVKTAKEPGKNQILGLCHEIEPNPSKDRAMLEGDNPSFRDEFIKCTFFLTVLFILNHNTMYSSVAMLSIDHNRWIPTF